MYLFLVLIVQRIIQLVCQLISNKPGCQKVFLAWQWETEWGGACLHFIQNIPGNLRVDCVGKETRWKHISWWVPRCHFFSFSAKCGRNQRWAQRKCNLWELLVLTYSCAVQAQKQVLETSLHMLAFFSPSLLPQTYKHHTQMLQQFENFNLCGIVFSVCFQNKSIKTNVIFEVSVKKNKQKKTKELKFPGFSCW